MTDEHLEERPDKGRAVEGMHHGEVKVEWRSSASYLLEVSAPFRRNAGGPAHENPASSMATDSQKALHLGSESRLIARSDEEF
ncbi:MAG: hypothetical protein IPP07_15035 [Holophagales bacterium]|nr:hypothetical protein [Holophagales bacterium]